MIQIFFRFAGKREVFTPLSFMLNKFECICGIGSEEEVLFRIDIKNTVEALLQEKKWMYSDFFSSLFALS